MGNSLRACTAYFVQVDNVAYFKYLTSSVNRLFLDECPGAWTECDGDGERADWIFVPKSDMAALLVRFANPAESQALLDQYFIDDYTAEDMVVALAHYLAVADPRNDFVALNWY